jgi:hypothetical protein
MKKILTILLAFLMFPVMFVNAEEQNVNAEGFAEPEIKQVAVGSYADRAQKLLTFLGIGNKDIFAQETVTRAQFAKMLAQAAVISDISEPDKQIYTDVSMESEYYPYIYALAVMNIMNGYGDSIFKPTENTSMDEAYTACVNALGYKPIAGFSGGFFSGYHDMVKRLGLDKGMSSAGGQATGYDIAILIYNMLNTNTAELRTDSVGKTLLDIKFDLTGYVGTISQIGKIGIDTQASAIGENQIMIDGVTYAIKKSYGEKLNEYIGCNVEFYVRDEKNDPEVVLAYPNKEIKTTTVLWDDVTGVTVSGGAITVEYCGKDEERSRKVRMESGASMILNDRATPLNAQEFDVPNTKTIFIDTDNDGKYEIARVSRYNNMIVSAIDNTNEAVYGKYEVYKEEELHTSEYEVKIIQNGTTVGMRNISVGDVLSIFVGGNGSDTSKKVFINRDHTVSGELKKITKEGYFVGDTLYFPAYNFTKAVETGVVKEPKLGDNVTLCLDIEGRIADIKYGDPDRIYAFIVSAKTLDDHAFEGKQNYSLHVFTENGEWKDYELRNEKVYVNDVKMTPHAAVMNHLQGADGAIIYQLLKLQLNSEEKIIRIDTAQIPADENEAEQLHIDGVFTQSNQPLYRYYSNKGGADIMFALNPSTPGWGYGEVEDAKADFRVTSSVKVMRIPPRNSPRETMEKEDMYTMGTGAMFPRWEWAYTVGYDGDSFGNPSILLWYQPEGKESEIMMVDNMGTIYNEDTGEVEAYIDVVTGSGKTSYRAEKTELFDGLQKGDIIKVKCDIEDPNKRHVVSLRVFTPSQLKNGTVIGVSDGMIRVMPQGESKSVLYAITAMQGPYFSGSYVELLKTASLKEGTKIVYNEYYGTIRSYIIVD